MLDSDSKFAQGIQEIKEQYEKDPGKSLEDFYGLKLYPYQKLLLKMAYKATWKGKLKC